MLKRIWLLSIMILMIVFSASVQSQKLPELGKQAYVGIQRFNRQYDREWVDQCLNLSLDKEKLGVEIIAYRIQWFNGSWSGWYVPGVNDLF